MNDLIQENKRLQAELDTLNKKYQKVKLLAQQQGELNKRTTNEVNKMVNTVNTLQAQVARVDLLEQVNGQLKHENEKLRGALEILQQKYDVLVAQTSSEKPIRLRKETTDIVSARVLNCYINTEDVPEVQVQLRDKYGYDIAVGKVYRTITVTEPNDYVRIMTLYRTYSEEFDGMTEEDLHNWFVIKRIKKLRLLSELELIGKFGAKLVRDILPMVEEDTYAKGYYDQTKFAKAKNLES